MTDKTNWNNIYNKKSPDEVSWYQPTPNISLTLIESLKVNKNDSIIDVGAGASTFVDNLLKNNYEKPPKSDQKPRKNFENRSGRI